MFRYWIFENITEFHTNPGHNSKSEKQNLIWKNFPVHYSEMTVELMSNSYINQSVFHYLPQLLHAIVTKLN